MKKLPLIFRSNRPSSAITARQSEPAGGELAGLITGPAMIVSRSQFRIGSVFPW